MQTFLPYPNFVKSAACLDRQRLGKQRVEAWQILNTLLGNSKGWINHPAIKMWDGHQKQLCKYGIAICRAWRKRGYKDTLLEKFRIFFLLYEDFGTPNWLGNSDFHASHRSNLLRKNPEYYSQFGWKEPDNLPYIWPVK
jgi:hypothetical protein